MSVQSRRCSSCNIDWPNIDDCRICPECHEQTWQCQATPDKTIGEARAAIQAKPYSRQHPDRTATQELPTINPVYAHRVDRYAAMGFTEAEAHLMASARDDLGFPVYHGRVSDLLAAGMTREQAVQVFA